MIEIVPAEPAGYATVGSVRFPVYRATQLGRDLRAIRRFGNLTRKQVAERLGLSLELVHGLEHGRYLLAGDKREAIQLLTSGTVGV